MSHNKVAPMDNNTEQLSAVLKQKFVDVIRDGAARAEKDGKFTKAQMNLAYEQHWFQMLMPAANGGLQMPLPDMLELAEALAWADGSFAWAITYCACAGWFSGFIDKDNKLLSGDKVCFTGSTDINGTAEKTAKGYLVNGYWQNAALANDATAFIVNCVETKNGDTVKNDDNESQLVRVILLASEVEVLSTWNGMGLAATASHDFEIKNVTVPFDRVLDTADAKSTLPLYQFPQLYLFESAIAVTMLGMTTHFTDICKLMFTEKKNSSGINLSSDATIMDIFQKNLQRVADARAKLYYAIQLAWQACTNNLSIKPAILYKVSIGAHELSKRCRECVDGLYPFLGLTAADKSAEINRIWRDIHTASLHSIIVYGNLPK
jgi:alkylation response protein AidB-like acyl-CoA dehydrogenase